MAVVGEKKKPKTTKKPTDTDAPASVETMMQMVEKLWPVSPVSSCACTLGRQMWAEPPGAPPRSSLGPHAELPLPHKTVAGGWTLFTRIRVGGLLLRVPSGTDMFRLKRTAVDELTCAATATGGGGEEGPTGALWGKEKASVLAALATRSSGMSNHSDHRTT